MAQKIFRLDASKCPNKVSAIKAYREATAQGLKEAKDAIEESMGSPIYSSNNSPPGYGNAIVGYSGGKEIEVRCHSGIDTEAKFKQIKQNFIDCGCRVIEGPDMHERFILKTKVIVLEAVASGDYKFARSLLETLIKDKEELNA